MARSCSISAVGRNACRALMVRQADATTLGMRSTRIQDVERPAAEALLVRVLLEGQQCNVRLIRLGPGQALPPHRHGISELMLYAVSGRGELGSHEGSMPFEAGALACLSGDEELRVHNTGAGELTLLAFLAPKFPPA